MLKKLLCIVAMIVFAAGIVSAAERKNPLVEMETGMGKVTIELYEKEAPLSVKNFLTYVQSGFYNGTIFHRVIPGFMAQGGGFTPDRKQKPAQAPIRNEAANGLKNDRGTIAMARTSVPDSATAQFFINVANNDMLNRPKPDGAGYAVFGKVVGGMDVVDNIVAAKTQNVNMMFQNLPVEPILIKSVKLLK